jgi:phage major head subunit gpT-like protein
MLTSANFQELLEPKFRQVFFDSYDELPEQFSDVFMVKTSKKAKEYDLHMAGTGLWDVKLPGANIDQEDMAMGEEVSYVHNAYAKMIQVEREFADDEMYGIVEKLPRQLGIGGRATVETTAAAILNNAFTVNGYDAVPLFSDSHPLIKGGTADNLMTASALNDANLKTGITMMRTAMKTEEGLKMQARAKKLVIPADLEFTAMTLLQSAGVVGSANNDTNVIKGRVTPVVLDYLTDVNAWFLVDPSLSQLTFFWRVKPEFGQAENFDGMIAKYRGYLRFSVGYSDWRGLIGNAGA